MEKQQACFEHQMAIHTWVADERVPHRSFLWGALAFNGYTKTHVEGHAAALMRQQGLTEGTLYLNRDSPCDRCIELLPRMLAPGTRLNIILADRNVMTFVGEKP